MKNKIFTKVILVVVCVSTLLVTFVVPSFAYTIDNPSAYNNTVNTSFTLPTMVLEFEKNSDAAYSDFKSYITIPMTDYDARGEQSIVSVTSEFNGATTTYAFKKNVTQSNVYENNGFYHGGSVNMKTTTTQLTSDSYHLYGVEIQDYFLNGINSLGSIYDSIQLHVTGDPFSETINNQSVDYFSCRYFLAFIDTSGVVHTVEFTYNVFVDEYDSATNSYLITLHYFPRELSSHLNVELSDIFFIGTLDCWLSAETGYVNMIPYSADNIVGQVPYVLRLSKPSIFNRDIWESVLANHSEYSYDLGVEDGYEDGYIEGHVDGLDLGLMQGFEQGRDYGFEEGYNDGYDDGYIVGYDEGSGLADKSPFDLIVDAIDSFISWEFVPGVSIGIVLTIVIGVSLLIAFLKVFAGG